MRSYKGKDFQSRLNLFASTVIKECKGLSQNKELSPLITQLIRSSSSIALNHAEATGTWTEPDFINKLRIALKEAQESKANLEILYNSSVPGKEQLLGLHKEADEICAILYSSIRTARRRK